MNLIHEAIVFASQKHNGQVRKGTKIPYISHPMEVMQILTENQCSETVIVAGILHDVLEDTDTAPSEIRKLFGDEVLKIVAAESEDKSKSWKERKQTTIDNLLSASLEVCLVCMADKLANLRSIVSDKEIVGEKIWERFNACEDDIAWYYKTIRNAIKYHSDFPYEIIREYDHLLTEVF